MQDDTQRSDATPAPAPGGPQPAPTTPPPTAPTPRPNQSTVTPRGLEGLRTESLGAEPRGFGSLGLAPERHDPLPFHTDLDTSLAYGYEGEPHEPVYMPLALSVGAGFKFGCGFMLAVAVSMFGLFLAASVVFFVAALAGLPVPGATP